MSPETQYVLIAKEDRRRFSLNTVLLLALLLLVALGGWTAWRWLDANLLHWGIGEGRTTVIDSAELLERIQALELTTLKHTYASNAKVDASKVFNAGPARVGLPGWIAGQELKVAGQVQLAAGTDLSQVTAKDMQITRQGNEVFVTITVPSAQIFSAEVLPSTLDMDTSQGVLTRLKTRLGFSEKDLRDQAVDRLVIVAKDVAVQNGLLEEAAREAEAGLQAFLNGLPPASGEKITYRVQARVAVTH